MVIPMLVDRWGDILPSMYEKTLDPEQTDHNSCLVMGLSLFRMLFPIGAQSGTTTVRPAGRPIPPKLVTNT